jgi:glycosyltransferase involved in cell wall biosynthesis
VRAAARTEGPLISIGVPVRNGGTLLHDALQQLVDQSYRNIEILISDNGSTDETGSICENFARMDSRIRLFHQPELLTAFENFRFVAERASGEYFLWAAHDDRRSQNYVEALVSGALDHPGASLVFSRLVMIDRHTGYEDAPLLRHDFAGSIEVPFYKRIVRYLFLPGIHFYGLYPTRVVLDWCWIDLDHDSDVPFNVYVTTRGDLVKVESAVFYYYRAGGMKSQDEQAQANFFRPGARFPLERKALATARAACHGERLEGRRRPVALVFAYLYGHLRWRWLKGVLYTRAPGRVQRLWRRWKDGAACVA